MMIIAVRVPVRPIVRITRNNGIMSTIGGTMRRERIVPRIALLPLISNRARGYAIPDARRIAKRD